MKVRHRQLYSNDCGKCVVNNLLHLYNIKEKVDLKYDENGCTIKEIISVLKKYFYVVKAINFSINQIKEIKNFIPFIAMIKNNEMSHYILIYKKSKTHLYILDSLYKKSYKITYEKFEEIDEKIYVIADEFKNNLFSIKNHKSLLLIPIISTIETIFLLSNTVLLQQIIDNGFKDAIIYILVQILLLIITTFKMNEFLKTFKKIDSKIIYNTTKGIYNLKKDFISNHDINELYFRTYDAYSYKGMILSFFFELISDVITLTLTLILMIFYLRLLTILILLICLLAVLFCIKIFKKVQLIIEQRRTSEYDFLNTYRDSFSSKDDIYFKKDKTLEEKSLKKLINFQKDDYVLQRTNMLKNLFFLYFQSIIISFVVILYFTNAFDYLSIGSLIALINLITLLLQPILNICSKIPEFSNYNLIKQRLKDIFDNID